MLLGRKALGTVAYLGGLPALLEPFAWSFAQLVQFNEEFLADDRHYVHYDRARISDHGPARNQLVATFLGEWLLQLDTDHQFEPDLVARLLRLADEHGIDVLAGVYQLKSPPHVPVLYQWVQVAGQPALQPLATWPDDVRLLEIGSAGGGCLWVRRCVFDRIVRELGDQPFDRIGGYSEDHSFFYRCRQLGIKAYAAMHVHAAHLRVAPVTLADLDAEGLAVSEPFPVGGFR